MRFAVLFGILLSARCAGGSADEARRWEELHAYRRFEIDGSSTVWPVSEIFVERFEAAHPRVNISVNGGGTSAGFRALCGGEASIIGASRPIDEAERASCARANVEYLELPIAYDGIVLVVHPTETWVDTMTVEELRLLWARDAEQRITRWSQVRATWPDEELRLYAPGRDSGTLDYFTMAILGKGGLTRADVWASEDDLVLALGVASDRHAVGFFGFGYYDRNRSRLRAVAIDDGIASNGDGAILPSAESVASGAYQPLSRPLFWYVNRAHADRAEVDEFVTSALSDAQSAVVEGGCVPLPERLYAAVRAQFAARKPGSMFDDHQPRVGIDLEALLRERP